MRARRAPEAGARSAAGRACCQAQRPPLRPARSQRLLALQRTVGNRACGRILGNTAEDAGAACVAAAPTIPACATDVDAAVRSGPAVTARRMLRSAIRVLGGPFSPELSRQLENSFRVLTPGPIPALRTRFQRMLALLDRTSYLCPDAASPCCHGLGYGAFVVTGRPEDVFLCPSFFDEPATERHGQPFTLLHELAHLAGVNGHHVRLQYYGGVECGPLQGLSNSTRGLDNTDSYPHFAACADLGLTSPVPRPETPRPRSRSLLDDIAEQAGERMRRRMLESVEGLLPHPFWMDELSSGPREMLPVRAGLPLPYRQAVEAVERARFFRNSGIVRVEPEIPAATVDHTLSGREIAVLSRGPRAAGENAGFTRAHLGMRMAPSTAAGAAEGGRIPFWLTSIDVTPHYRSITVYVAREYAAGSCEHRETLAHENEHVGVDVELLERYAGRMRAALVFSDLPTAENPLHVASAAEGEERVERLLRGILTPVYDELRLRLREANDALDAPEHYARVHARCNNMVAPARGRHGPRPGGCMHRHPLRPAPHMPAAPDRASILAPAPGHPLVVMQRAAGNRAAGAALSQLPGPRQPPSSPAAAAAAPCRGCGAAGSGVLRKPRGG